MVQSQFIDIPSLRIVRRLEAPEMDGSQIVLSEAVGIVVCGGRNGTVACLDTTDGREVWKASIHSTDVSSLAISPDGSRVVSAATDGEHCVNGYRNGRSAPAGCTSTLTRLPR